MKKILAVILTAVILAGLLCSCGASKMDSASSYDLAAEAKSEEAYYEYYTDDVYKEAPAEEPAAYDSDESTVLNALTNSKSINDKIIYTATACIQTVEFDNAVEKIYALIDRFDGFVESSYVSGANYTDKYYGYQTYRNAHFTIRVPKENYAGMTDSLSEIGNVTSVDVSADNITQQFTDAEARLETYKAEEQRLLEMMEMAETVEDLISVEARLSEVRYQIEAITSTLRNWQNEVDYSTVNINLDEVRELTEIVETHRTFGQEIADGLRDTFKSIGRFFRDLAAWFVINLPVIILVLVFIAVIIFVIVLIIRGIKKFLNVKKQRKREKITDESEKE